MSKNEFSLSGIASNLKDSVAGSMPVKAVGKFINFSTRRKWKKGITDFWMSDISEGSFVSAENIETEVLYKDSFCQIADKNILMNGKVSHHGIVGKDLRLEIPKKNGKGVDVYMLNKIKNFDSDVTVKGSDGKIYTLYNIVNTKGYLRGGIRKSYDIVPINDAGDFSIGRSFKPGSFVRQLADVRNIKAISIAYSDHYDAKNSQDSNISWARTIVRAICIMPFQICQFFVRSATFFSTLPVVWGMGKIAEYCEKKIAKNNAMDKKTGIALKSLYYVSSSVEFVTCCAKQSVYFATSLIENGINCIVSFATFENSLHRNISLASLKNVFSLYAERLKDFFAGSCLSKNNIINSEESLGNNLPNNVSTEDLKYSSQETDVVNEMDKEDRKIFNRTADEMSKYIENNFSDNYKNCIYTGNSAADIRYRVDHIR